MAKKNKPNNSEEEAVVGSDTAPKPSSDAGNASKYRYIYARKSVERRIRRRRIAIVLLIFVLIASLIAGAAYAVLSFMDFNSFRVSITQGKAVLTLSNDDTFSNPTSQLSTGSAKTMLDTTYSELPMMRFRNMDGSYAGEYNFFGSSFYLRNTSEEDLYYDMRILITDVYNGLDECLRVLVIREPLVQNADGEWELLSSTKNDTSNMEWICYAKQRSTPDENGETRERVSYNVDRNGEYMDSTYDPNYGPTSREVWYCTNFLDAKLGTVADKNAKKLEPWQKVRYTIAIWLEGSDPDTTDDKLGGTLTMNVSFSALNSSDIMVDEVDQEISDQD